MFVYGAVEAGGTKFVVGTGAGPHDVKTTQIPTTTPAETLARAIEYLRSHGPLQALGIASFGPVDLDRESPHFGYITSTPKAAWRDTDLVGAFREALQLPIGFDTDVNAAALAENRWGAARGLSSCLYLTIGTGIGGGAIVNGRTLQGLSHPEMGHIKIPRDPEDRFAGVCPFHGDCLEGLASGPAIAARWGSAGARLPPEHEAWRIEASYLAAAVANFICTLSPACVVLGGGVMQQRQLFNPIREGVARILNGYARVPPIVAPGLGSLSGISGALALAASV